MSADGKKRARCTVYGSRGRTRIDPANYMCRQCYRELLALGTHASDELTGGRWVQDGWIQRWVEDEEAA